MGNYHPHGDSSIYEALVRMAQPFALRMSLVEGTWMLGSMQVGPAVALRYAECRITPISGELLANVGEYTVPVGTKYGCTKSEPVVLPSKLPHLLIHGATGIAVGMATNIPSHNPEEVC